MPKTQTEKNRSHEAKMRDAGYKMTRLWVPARDYEEVKEDIKSRCELFELDKDISAAFKRNVKK